MGKTIVFWSPKSGHSGVTACVCAVAAALTTGKEARLAAVAHTSLSKYELEERLDCHIEERRGELYERMGLAALMLHLKKEELKEEAIRHCGILLSGSTLELFPGGGKSLFALQEKEREEILLALLLEKLPMAYDCLLVDLMPGSNQLSMDAIEKAYITVIVLPQDPKLWKKFFSDEFWKLKAKNVFFLLGGALMDAKYGIREFLKVAGNVADRGRVGMIPRNTEYLEAMAEGRVIEFFLKNERGRKGEGNAAFVEQTRRTARSLLGLADRAGRKKKIFLSGTLQSSEKYVE